MKPTNNDVIAIALPKGRLLTPILELFEGKVHQALGRCAIGFQVIVPHWLASRAPLQDFILGQRVDFGDLGLHVCHAEIEVLKRLFESYFFSILGGPGNDIFQVGGQLVVGVKVNDHSGCVAAKAAQREQAVLGDFIDLVVPGRLGAPDRAIDDAGRERHVDFGGEHALGAGAERFEGV